MVRLSNWFGTVYTKTFISFTSVSMKSGGIIVK